MTAKKRGSTKSPIDFAKAYRVNVDDSSFGSRLADFLNAAAGVMPKVFFSRPIVAMVVFHLSSVPKPYGRAYREYVDDLLPKAIKSASRILLKRYGKLLVPDRKEGVRATVDEDDVIVTKYRMHERRFMSALNSLTAIGDTIDTSKVKSPALKKEALSKFRIVREVTAQAAKLPQLPPLKFGDDRGAGSLE